MIIIFLGACFGTSLGMATGSLFTLIFNKIMDKKG